MRVTIFVCRKELQNVSIIITLPAYLTRRSGELIKFTCDSPVVSRERNTYM